MERRFSWCTVVAFLLLLFVTAEALRGISSQNDDQQKPQAATSRGSHRFNPKPTEESGTTSSSISRSRSGEGVSYSRRTSTANKEQDKLSKSATDPGTKIDVPNSRSKFRPGRTTEKSIESSTIGARSRNGEHAGISGRRPSRRQVEDVSNSEHTIRRRNDRKYLPDSGEKIRIRKNDQDIQLETPKESFTSRRAPSRRSTGRNEDEKLDNVGPSVFAATTEYSRSRTGRKIHTTYSAKELKSGLPASRRFSNRGTERSIDDLESTTLGQGGSRDRSGSRTGRGRNPSKTSSSTIEVTTIGVPVVRRGEDLLSESESVRVDIPLTVSARNIERRSDDIEASRLTYIDTHPSTDRPKTRGRSADSESSQSRSNSRRGSSKFSDSTTLGYSDDIIDTVAKTDTRKANGRSRNPDIKSRNSPNESRSRTRGRNVDNNLKTNSNSPSSHSDNRRRTGERSLPEGRSRSSDARSRNADNRVPDQDSRTRLRGRQTSKSETTPAALNSVATAVTEATIPEVESSSSPDAEAVTTATAIPTQTTASPTPVATTTTKPVSTAAPDQARGRGRGRTGPAQARAAPKEDFFNHGLGFRGRKLNDGTSTTQTDARKSSPRNEARGNPGWTLRRRPGHVNQSEASAKNLVTVPRVQTNEVISSSEQLLTTEATTTIGTITSTRRGSKKPKTGQENGDAVDATTSKSTRRGNKTFDKASGSVSGKHEPEESDNYPPEFKARLSQLKSTNLKLPGVKPTRHSAEERLKKILGRRLQASSQLVEPDVSDLETAASGNVFPTDLTPIAVHTSPLTPTPTPETRHFQ